MIVFGLYEEEEGNQHGIGDIEQKVIDKYEVYEILDHMNQSQLKHKVVGIQRLGGKAEGKIRPIRVEFYSAYDRETACKSAHHLKNSNKFKNTVGISRDKIREDRERERSKYLEKRRRNNEINATASASAQGTINEEQINALLSETRAVTSTADRGDTAHPREAETETSP